MSTTDGGHYHPLLRAGRAVRPDGYAKSDDGLQTHVASLKAQNVVITVCNNTLSGREINFAEDLYDVWEEDIVASGVAELSHLQSQGYTYIKP